MLKAFFRYISKFRRELKLVSRLNRELRKLKESVDSRRKIILESRHILLIIKQLERTDLYWFIKDDIIKIKKYIKRVRKNPKNKGLVYFLTSVYIISPGTFERTGIILFFRYMWRSLFGK